MAGGGFLSSMFTTVIAKLHSLASSSTATSSSSSSPHSNIEQEMCKLTETMRRIQAKLADSEEENHHVKSHSEKLWLSELKDVAYDAEDVVDEYEYEMLRLKHEVRDPSVITLTNTSIITDELANKAAEIRKRFDEITKEWKLLTLPENAGKRKRSPLPLDMNRETGPLVVESDVLGRVEEKDMLVEWLLSEDDSTENRVSVIAIIGMGGLGKTTLAQLVYNDPRVKSYFNLRKWVCVSENFHIVSLTEKILQSFPKVKVHEEQDGLQHALKEKLQGEKFLLILDDVWNEDFTLWDDFRKPLVSAQMVKVIVTTRNQPVARIMETRSSLNLNCLPFDVCWSLFKRVTLGGADKRLQPHLEDLGRKIVDKCKGLPLAVKVLGGALRHNEDIESWEDILENEMWELEQANNGILPALQISYDCMPIQLQRCFQYLSLFHKGACLNSEQIVRLWMSQGLLPLDGRDKRAEDTGRNYIKRLAERSMLNLDNESFSMHDLVHDLAQSIAQDECLCVIDEKFDSKILQKIRHLSVSIEDLAQSIAQDECLCVIDEKFDSKKLQKIRHLSVSIEDLRLLKHRETVKDLQQLKRMRTLFIRKYWFEGSIHSGLLEPLFEKLKCIRALQLSHRQIPGLPDSIGNLKQLRYLSIQSSEIRSLPESICSLYNLQTLDLKDTSISELPRQIGNLINLRHLLLPDDFAFLPPGIGNLTNLQTLTRFNLKRGKEHPDVGELNGLMKLGGHISIYNATSVNIFSNSMPPLKTKKYLDSLMLDWLGGDFFSFPRQYEKKNSEKQIDYLEPHVYLKTLEKNAEKQLEYLEPHVNLKTLQISRYPGVRFAGWVGDSSFNKLTHLSVSKCENCTKLPPLGQLPSLEFLAIGWMYSLQHVGREFCSMLSPSFSQNRIAFPSLKRLIFKGMPIWKAWDGVEVGDFPNLHFIQISCYAEPLKFPQWPFLSSVKEMKLCAELDVPNLHSVINLDIFVTTQKRSEWMSKCYFPMLQHLELSCLVESVHLSQTQIPSLKTLEIYSQKGLRIVAGLKNLTSLNSLTIKCCPNLEFKGLPATLQQLKLKGCPLFKRGLQKQRHMPNLLIIEEEEE